MDSFGTESCIQGFHIYNDIWLPLIKEQLKYTKEADNSRDHYAGVAVNITPVSTETVGHVPQCISAVCSTFLQRGAEICCTATGSRRYSRDLLQGGLEVPYILRFMGSGKELKLTLKHAVLSKGEKSMEI